MRISDWSSDVCSSDLPAGDLEVLLAAGGVRLRRHPVYDVVESNLAGMRSVVASPAGLAAALIHSPRAGAHVAAWLDRRRPAWRGAVVCISEAAASSFRNGRGLDIKVAKRPDEASIDRKSTRLNSSN